MIEFCTTHQRGWFMHDRDETCASSSDERPTPDDAAKVFDTMDRVVRAPWDIDQRISLNEFQNSGAFHPFTCDGTNESGCAEKLYAAEDGWHCPTHDEYEQDWAWPWMANGEWKMFHQQMLNLWGDENDE